MISCRRGIYSSRVKKVIQVEEYPWKQIFLVADIYLVANATLVASSSSGVIPSSTVSLVVEIFLVAVVAVGIYHRCSWQ